MVVSEITSEDIAHSPNTNSVLSGDNEHESFADCECLDDVRTDSLSDDKLPFKDAFEGVDKEIENKENKVDGTVIESDRLSSLIRLDKLKSLESAESVVTDNESVIGSVTNSEIDGERRTSVIDPPSGFQTSTPSSKEDLEICVTDTKLRVEPDRVFPIDVAPVISWTRSELRNSSKLQRGSSVEVF